MKFTDFLQDVGRPIAYYPKMKKLTGSTTATILLCQFMYWRGKESGGDGWLYKTSEEIEEETGLTYNEQKTARKSLVDNGLIEEHYARLDHQLRFHLNLDAINAKWGVEQPQNGECDDSTFGNDGLSQSLNESEITAENTTSGKPPLSEIEVQQANAKVDAIIANSARADWRGRETFAPQDWTLVDWYHKATGQDCPKAKYKDWHHAVALWKSNGLTVADLQAAYDMDIKWRGVFTSPNQLNDKAIALRAQGKVKTDEQRPEYKPFTDNREGLEFVPNPKAKK